MESGISLEGMMLKLKLQYFGHLMQRVDSLEKTLMLGGIGGRSRRGRQRMRWLDGITDSMDLSLSELREGGAWLAAVHEVEKSRTWLSDFTFIFHFHALEKEMATHSSVLAWRIPGTGEPGGLPSLGLHGVRHDWSDLAAAAAASYDVVEDKGHFFNSLNLFIYFSSQKDSSRTLVRTPQSQRENP